MAVNIQVPLIRQKYTYTCGVAALQAVMVYYNVYPDTQEKLIESLKADPIVGTEPENIIKFAKKKGLKTKEFHEMTLKQLKTQIDQHHPVICLIQAWGKPEEYIDGYSGHYVTAVGYDEINFYFVDPAIEGVLGFLPIEEFERRWYFSDSKEVLKQYGIAIWKSKFQYVQRFVKID